MNRRNNEITQETIDDLSSSIRGLCTSYRNNYLVFKNTHHQLSLTVEKFLDELEQANHLTPKQKGECIKVMISNLYNELSEKESEKFLNMLKGFLSNNEVKNLPSDFFKNTTNDSPIPDHKNYTFLNAKVSGYFHNEGKYKFKFEDEVKKGGYSKKVGNYSGEYRPLLTRFDGADEEEIPRIRIKK